MNFAQCLSRYGRFRGNTQFNDLKARIFKRHQLDKAERGQFGFDEREDRSGRTDCYIDTQLLEDLSMLRVIYTRNCTSNFEALFGNLADHQVVFVFTCHSNNHIRTAGPNFLHCSGFAGIASYHRLAQLFVQSRKTGGIFLEQQHFMSVVEQTFSEVVANIATASDNNVHRFPLFLSDRGLMHTHLTYSDWPLYSPQGEAAETGPFPGGD